MILAEMKFHRECVVKRRVFVDMDGVMADYAAAMVLHNVAGDVLKNMPNVYRELNPIEGAFETIRAIRDAGFEVWIATKTPTGNAQAYADKVHWILEHLPDFKRNIIITHDKGLLGNANDFLIDDRPHKANCENFPGKFIHFHEEQWTWKKIGIYFNALAVAMGYHKAAA